MNEKKNLTIEETFALAVQNHKKNNLQVAENLYKKILKTNPNYAGVYYNLGIMYKELEEYQKAIGYYEKAIQIDPNHTQAHNNLGMVFKESEELQKAISCFQKAIHIQPNYADAHNNLGLAFIKLREYQKAISCFQKAIQLNPNHASAHTNLGIVLKELGEYQKAISCYEKAIQINSNYAEAHNNLGVVLKELGKYQKAINCYEKAIQINPNNADIHYNLGIVFVELGEYQKAINCYEKVIQINSNYAEAYLNLGNILSVLGKYDEATETYHQVIKIKSDYAKAYSNLLFNLNYKIDWDPDLFLSEARKFRINCGSKKKLSFKYQYEKNPTKLKIGCVSADFGDHPGGYFSLSTLKELQKKNFELIAYETSNRKDEFSPYFKPLFSKWHLIEKKKDNEVVEQIIKDGIHILIDLQGHSAKNRLPIFIYKPAPVQVSWLGQASTGIPEIDYLIGSPHITPKEEENHFIEKIWRLPEITVCFTPPDFEVQITSLPAVNNNFITFGSFNKLSKMNDEVIALWSKILLSIPNSKLLIKSANLDHQQIIESTFERFNKCKIEKKRLILQGKLPTRKEVLEVYNKIDIALDPFPFQGNTTTCEAVWMGVPVITLKGNRYIFHFGESINANLNMHDWIAEDSKEYVSKAIKFSSDINQLSKIRMNLRKIALQSPVFDAQRFSDHFSKMLWNMWKKLNIL